MVSRRGAWVSRALFDPILRLARLGRESGVMPRSLRALADPGQGLHPCPVPEAVLDLPQRGTRVRQEPLLPARFLWTRCGSLTVRALISHRWGLVLQRNCWLLFKVRIDGAECRAMKARPGKFLLGFHCTGALRQGDVCLGRLVEGDGGS